MEQKKIINSKQTYGAVIASNETNDQRHLFEKSEARQTRADSNDAKKTSNKAGGFETIEFDFENYKVQKLNHEQKREQDMLNQFQASKSAFPSEVED